jgi:hypothetical protein
MKKHTNILKIPVTGLVTQASLQALYASEPERSARSFRLFFCACLRANWSNVPNETKRFIILIESICNGIHVPASILQQSYTEASKSINYLTSQNLDSRWAEFAIICFHRGDDEGIEHCIDILFDNNIVEISQLSDIFHDTFCPTHVSDFEIKFLYTIGAIRPEILILAKNIIEEYDFNSMSKMADLLAANNASDQILHHCHNKVHHRGCWLIDAILQLPQKAYKL